MKRLACIVGNILSGMRLTLITTIMFFIYMSVQAQERHTCDNNSFPKAVLRAPVNWIHLEWYSA